MPKKGSSVLGAKLKQARKDRHFTQEKLAEMANMSTRHIANIEKGDVNPSFEVLSTLTKALGVSFDSIFDPAGEQVEAEIQEITGLYRTCPEEVRRLILVSIRAMAREVLEHQQPQKRKRKASG